MANNHFYLHSVWMGGKYPVNMELGMMICSCSNAQRDKGFVSVKWSLVHNNTHYDNHLMYQSFLGSHSNLLQHMEHTG